MALPEVKPETPAPPAPNKQPEAPPRDLGQVPMTEEFDRAKWTLPPIVPVVIALVAVAIAIAIFTVGTSWPKAAGKILNVYAADVAGGNRTMVTVQFSFQNLDKAPMWVRDVHVQIKPAGQKESDAPLDDRSASVSDLNRYLQAFPDLAAHKTDPFPIDQKIAPGGSVQGMVLVAFPVDKNSFDKRQWLHVVVTPYDHLPIIITQ
jgi:hypothetical protein